MDVYAQNAYWHAQVVESARPAFPDDMPTIATEWSGSEGSNRGPLGEPGARAFPDTRTGPDGWLSEESQAAALVTAFSAWFPDPICGSGRPGRCVSGLVYFTWQDVDWPAFGFFYQGHYAALRNGLVYEDRVVKRWPISLFQYLMDVLRLLSPSP